jgi:hypothetical protein
VRSNTKYGLIALACVALVGKGASASPSLAEMQTYTIPLTGQAEVNFAHPGGGTGDLKGSGLVELKITPATRQVCYHFSLSGLAQPLMAHIHRGQPLRVGPPVVTLFTGPGGDLDSCVSSTHSQLADIVEDPSNFYVSVETLDYPDGALRGQL